MKDLIGSACVWVLSHFSCTQLCATPRTIAYQAPLSMGLSRQEDWTYNFHTTENQRLRKDPERNQRMKTPFL